MNQHKIAILTDSGTDVPEEFSKAHGIFTLPLSIQFSDGLYLDGVSITPEEVYNRLPREIPKTSLPSAEAILYTLQEIRESGVETLFIITISSALSGTFNLMRLTSHDVPELDCRLIDTKNIGIGAGFTVMRAAEMIDAGASADEIEAALCCLVKSTKVFFCLPTLEYLAKGGRIGRVTATVGSLLDVRPIISCNEEGVYYTGVETLFIITISSALSGTFNLMRLTSHDVPELDCRLIDTKNIGIGAGFTVMRAAEMIDAGASADEIEAALCCLVKSTKVFFCLPTLEYLAKGGRIGRVTATVGSLLDVRPIISCNEEGVYYTVQKARGAVRALAAALQNAADYAKEHAYHLAIAHGGVPELAAHVEAQLAGLIHSARSYVRTQVSPALGVHTGPGLIGIGVQRLV